MTLKVPPTPTIFLFNLTYKIKSLNAHKLPAFSGTLVADSREEEQKRIACGFLRRSINDVLVFYNELKRIPL